MHVEAGGRTFSWTFLLADVAPPIIGADFLKHLGFWSTWERCGYWHVGAVGAIT